MYEGIKKNFIEKFLNPNYLWTCSMSKSSIVANIKQRCPFDIDIQDDEDIIVDFGDDIVINVKLEWEEREQEVREKKMTNYKLVKIY